MSNEVKAISAEETSAIMKKFFEGDGTDLLKIAQLNTMNISGLSQQMGLVNARLDEQSARLDKVEEGIGGIRAELTVNRAQANRIRNAIRDRVTYVLGIDHDGGVVCDDSIPDDVKYRPGFYARIYTDARTHSKLGTPYYATLRCDFSEVMDYINAWYPSVDGGVEGFKRYLDIRHENKGKKR